MIEPLLPASALRSGSALPATRPARLLLTVPHRFFFLTGVIQIAVDRALVGLGARRSRLAGRSRARGRGSGDIAARADDAVRIRAVLHVRLPLHRGPALAGRGTAAAVRMAPARARWRRWQRWRSSRSKWRVWRTASSCFVSRRARTRPGGSGSRSSSIRLIRASDAEDKLHAILVFGALCVGASVVAAFALFGPAAHGGSKGPACGPSCCPCS